MTVIEIVELDGRRKKQESMAESVLCAESLLLSVF